MSAYTNWSFLLSNIILVYSIASFNSYLAPYIRSTHTILLTFDDFLVSNCDQNSPTGLLDETDSFYFGDNFLVVFVDILEIPGDFILFIFLLLVLDFMNV